MLHIKNLAFNYPDAKQLALEKISFDVNEGEVISIIGESGSGKSTLLKLVYGLEDFDQGEIYWKDKHLRGPAYNILPGHKMMKYVAQDYDLLDFVTVGENVGKFLSNFDLDKKHRQIKDALRVVEMENYIDHFPNKLSGGQRQRVSIARALAQMPEVLLLDEPFSNIDQSLKISIRERIVAWCKENNITVLFTTHDVNDALYTSDRILVLQNGKLVQFDEVEKVRDKPNNSYVAKLFGFINLVSVGVFNKLKLNEVNQFSYYQLIYPEEVWINDDGNYTAEVIGCKYQGRDFLIKLKYEDFELVTYFPFKVKIGSKLRFSIPDDRIIKV